MNDLNDDIKENLEALVKRTNEDFGLTLSGNAFTKDSIDKLQGLVVDLHKKKVLGVDPAGHIDSLIGAKRIAF